MVFPAQAGMILDFSSGIEKPLGIPRTSGDDPVSDYSSTNHFTYSPHKRG